MFEDILKNELKVGDYIAYALRSGNSSEMKIGKILELRQNGTYRVQAAEVSPFSGRWHKNRPSIVSPGKMVKISTNDIPEFMKEIIG
jgi:hypothetical protein